MSRSISSSERLEARPGRPSDPPSEVASVIAAAVLAKARTWGSATTTMACTLIAALIAPSYSPTAATALRRSLLASYDRQQRPADITNVHFELALRSSPRSQRTSSSCASRRGGGVVDRPAARVGRDERDAAAPLQPVGGGRPTSRRSSARRRGGSSSVTLSDSVQCTHRGACYHVVPQTTTFPCNIDQFPFDRQLCHIRIGWAHDRCAQDVLPRPINCTAGSSSASAAIATATGDGLPYQWSWPAGARRATRGASSTSSTTNRTTSSSCARCT